MAANGCLGTRPSTALGVTMATALASSLLTSLEHAWYKDPIKNYNYAAPGALNNQAGYMVQMVGLACVH